MTTKTKPRLLTSEEVCNLASITYRILDYWTREGLFTPIHDVPPDPTGLRNYPGSGIQRRWPTREAAKVAMFAAMLRDGIAHERAAELLRQGQVGHVVAVDLRAVIIDDLPPASWDTE